MAAWRVLEICMHWFEEIKLYSVDIFNWLDTTTVLGETYGELIFGSGMTFVLGWAVIKFFGDIWPG